MGNMKKNKKECLFSIIIMLMSVIGVVMCNIDPCKEGPATDNDINIFGRNLQHLSAEIFLCGSTGKGADAIDPSLAAGGPPPIGCQIANLDPFLRRFMEECGYQEIDELRFLGSLIVGKVPPRPLLDLRKKVIADLFQQAFDEPLIPPFDPYATPLNIVLLLQFITYNGMVGLVGAAPALALLKNREAYTKFLAIEAGQNAVLRGYLSERENDRVVPYNITVAEFTSRTSELANRLGKCGLKDEGIRVPRPLGADNRTESNVLAGDVNSLAYTRTTKEILRVIYGTGRASIPGAFYTQGFNGKIARNYIQDRTD